ncbi:MAG: hypothetical protein JXR53_09620 [Bacteroidales bacterium]|nr:hypothetical protein [Bacteroidales bacterium]
MNCKEVKYRIENLQSSEELSTDMKDHVETCSSCRMYFNLLSSIDHASEIWPDIHADEELPDKIIAYVAAKSNWGKHRSLWPAISGIAASLILGFIIGYALFNFSATNTQDEYLVSGNESTEQTYMTQTTDLLYYDAFMSEETNYEK